MKTLHISQKHDLLSHHARNSNWKSVASGNDRLKSKHYAFFSFFPNPLALIRFFIEESSISFLLLTQWMIEILLIMSFFSYSSQTSGVSIRLEFLKTVWYGESGKLKFCPSNFLNVSRFKWAKLTYMRFGAYREMCVNNEHVYPARKFCRCCCDGWTCSSSVYHLIFLKLPVKWENEWNCLSWIHSCLVGF